jgi:hypothetical protein
MAEVHYRDAGTGEFVTEEYALANPATTVKETEPDPPEPEEQP